MRELNADIGDRMGPRLVRRRSTACRRVSLVDHRGRMARQVALAILLAVGYSVSAQQPDAPVEIGSPGVSPLQFVTYVAPVYPEIAATVRVSGEVVLDATIGVDGRPRDIRILRSIPLLDQAAIDAARQWRFAPPTVRGALALVRVPIRAVFHPHGGAVLPESTAVQIQNPSLPRDFAIVFASSCPDGGEMNFNTVTGPFEIRRGIVSVRVRLWVEPSLIDQIYKVIANKKLLSDTTRLAQWPNAAPKPEVTDSAIRVAVFQGNKPPVMSWSHGRPPRQLLVDVRMNGTWTRLFPPASWPFLYPPDKVDARDGELEKGALQIARLLEKHVQSFEVIRKLPRNQQWCRWPD